MIWKRRTCQYFFAIFILLSFASMNAFSGDTEIKILDQRNQPDSDAHSKTKKWALRQPKENKIAYRGMANFDSVGTQSGAMLYPAPNAIGLIAAILTHAAISDASQSSEKNRLQEEADKVLNPYRNVLDSFSSQELMQSALKRLSPKLNARLIGYSEKANDDWSVEIAPIFSLTQDQHALVLDNVIVIAPPGGNTDSQGKVAVRVLSTPINDKNPSESWLAKDGAKLKAESASLVAQSLLIALNASAANDEDDKSFQTIRYREGSTEKMERARILDKRCDRALIKSLRGVFMSVPLPSSASRLEVENRCGDEDSSSGF